MEIKILYLSRAHHCSQLVTGFYQFCQIHHLKLVIENHIDDPEYPYKGVYVLAKIADLTLVYDMSDGYQDPEGMRWFLGRCDFYFKRSFSRCYNTQFSNSHKIHPYGFNYFVTYKGNPLDGPYYKEVAKHLLGMNRNTIFTPNAFEESPKYVTTPKILFSVRLWAYDPSLSRELNEERAYINEMRVSIVKKLKRAYKQDFVGGLYDTSVAQKIAPSLIIPSAQTNKNKYLRILHQCDICVATMGLHESIGGKMGEYVAAAKAIVSENLHYEVTGAFVDGINYLSFDSSDQCLSQVESLYSNPDRLYRMKVENAIYYQQYLRPDILIGNTLHVAGVDLY